MHVRSVASTIEEWHSDEEPASMLMLTYVEEQETVYAYRYDVWNCYEDTFHMHAKVRLCHE